MHKPPIAETQLETVVPSGPPRPSVDAGACAPHRRDSRYCRHVFGERVVSCRRCLRRGFYFRRLPRPRLFVADRCRFTTGARRAQRDATCTPGMHARPDPLPSVNKSTLPACRRPDIVNSYKRQIDWFLSAHAHSPSINATHAKVWLPVWHIATWSTAMLCFRPILKLLPSP